MKGAYEIIPFYATDIRGGFIKVNNIVCLSKWY